MPSRNYFSQALIREFESKTAITTRAGGVKATTMKTTTMAPIAAAATSSRGHKAIKRGERILTEQPFAFVLKSKYRQERCDHCLALTKVLKCANCQYVYYCNRACQLQAWPLHKIECPFLKRVQPRTVPDAARMLCRLILKLDKGGDLVRGYYTPTCSRRFRDLMSHYAEIRNDTKRLEHLASLHAVLCEMMADSTIVPNITELTSIYGRLVTNGFNILDGEMNSIGTGIYLGISVTDHSCTPNAVATFEGTELHLNAIEDIDCLDWSKIFISYVDLLNTADERRADLSANYYFLCICSKCVDAQQMQEMRAAACANRKCDALLDIALNNCQRCGAGISPKQRNDYNEAMALTETHLEQMKEVAYLDVCKICLTRQSGCLHSLNLWHVKTLDAAFEAAIAVGKWPDALDYGKQLLPGFRKYYGDWNPLLGVNYMKMGKILLHDNHPREALLHLQEAGKILHVTHGREHSLIKEHLQPLICQASIESNSSKG